MSEQIIISAKNLGGVAMPGFCPRCFWIQMHSDGISLPDLSRHLQLD